MEFEENEVNIDYDTIQAPQFVDFEALSIADGDEEDPASQFFQEEKALERCNFEPDHEQEQTSFVTENHCENENESLRKEKEQESDKVECQQQEPPVDPNPIGKMSIEKSDLTEDQRSVLAENNSPSAESCKLNPNVSSPSAESCKLNHNVSSPPVESIPVRRMPAEQAKSISRITVPKPFHLQNLRPKTIDPRDKEIHFSFKARTVPVKVLHGLSTGLKDKPETKPTVAVAPHFASDDRIRFRQLRASMQTGTKENVEPPPIGRGRSRSMTRSVPSTPIRGTSITRAASRGRSPSPAVRTDKGAVTVTKPFSFEEREKERKRIRDEKIRQQERTEADAKRRTFHANPLPSFKPHVPLKTPIPPTNPEPFQLKVDERGTKHQEIFRKKLEEEERLRKEQATFHANPPTVIFKAPFEPEASDKLPTEPLDIVLNSEIRAQTREEFDLQLKEKEMIEENQRRQDEANRLMVEQKQAQEMRKQLVHKAQPIKGTRPFQLKHSGKPLTTPMSPAFKPLPSQRRKLQQLHNNELE